LQTWTYVPNANAFGKDTFTLQVRDEKGAVESRTVEILIENIDDPLSGLLTIDIKGAGGTTITNRAPQRKDLLSVNSSALQDPDGIGRLRYQWFSIEGDSKTDIVGATNESLLLTNALIGKRLGARVSYTDGGGKLESIEQVLSNAVQEAGPTTQITSISNTGASRNGRDNSIYQVDIPGEISQAPRQVSLTTSGGSFIDRTFSVVTSSAVNAQAYTNSDPDLSLTQFAVEFELDADQPGGNASAFIPLDIFGTGLQAPGGPANSPRRRRLTYFGVDQSGITSSLIYDPIHTSGARFYDLSGDGTADYAHLSLKDGGYGDKDGIVNGVIVDPSLPGSTLINPQLSINSSLLTVADPGNTTPVSLPLRVSLTSRSNTANQIYYLVLNQDEVAKSNHLIDDLGFLKSRSRNLFSTLENSDVILPAGMAFETEILLVNGQSAMFFEIADDTLDSLLSARDGRISFLKGNGAGEFSSISGVRLSLSLSNTDPGLSSLIGQEQGLAPILDFTAFGGGQAVRGTLVMGREASYDSVTGFYRVVDRQGSVLDANGNLLTPGVASIDDYRNAALKSSNLVDELTGLRIGNGQTSSREITIKESTHLAPYATTNGNTFFAFAAANIDNFAHFRVLGNNLFGYEDLLGGGDKDVDDQVLGFTFTQVI
jgi:hypothetical protein